MRKVDSSAYNKRLHAEILDLEKMVKDINPENINLFDSTLISTAESYISLISNSAWSNNSNFNGIEMNKIQGMFNRLKVFRNKLYVGREVVVVVKEEDSIFKLNHVITAPKNFDARNSIVIPRFIDSTLQTGIYSKKIEDSMSLYYDTKFVAYKQQSKIIVDFELAVTDEFADKICIAFLYIMWR